jgi:hypothetical protein
LRMFDTSLPMIQGQYLHFFLFYTKKVY